MIVTRKWRIFGMVAVIFGSTSIAGNLAYSADCLPDLTKAESRWEKLKKEKKMTPELQREVTQQLTTAAELRHEGMSDDCLLQLGIAMKEMNLLESRH